jgi:hypothetical protein
MMGTKTIEVTLQYHGDGSIRAEGNAMVGGVVAPNLKGNISFTMHPQAEDENGILNPIDGAPTVEGSFQINVYGNSNGFRELGRYFLALAELDVSEDAGFHDHFDDLRSLDGRTHVHLIARKNA